MWYSVGFNSNTLPSIILQLYVALKAFIVKINDRMSSQLRSAML